MTNREHLAPESLELSHTSGVDEKAEENLLAAGHRAKEIKRRKFGRRHSPLRADHPTRNGFRFSKKKKHEYIGSRTKSQLEHIYA